MVKLIDAILSINPNAQVTIQGDDINEITWDNGTAVISNEDILAKKTELENNAEAEARAKEDLKASAKAKLMNGEALTEEEANTIVL